MPALIAYRREATFLAGIIHRWPLVTVMVLSTAGLLTVGCGSGAFRAPSEGQPGPVTTSGGPAQHRTSPAAGSQQQKSPPAAGAEYGYSLPYGDTPFGQDDAVVYRWLLDKNCSLAQRTLNDTWFKLGDYYGGPRMVVIYQAAIEMCRGNELAARSLVEMAKARYGLAGLAKDEYTCKAYRALSSFLDQVSQSSISCPPGDIPWWPDNRTCDDPRTVANECTRAPPSTEPPIPTTEPPIPTTEPPIPTTEPPTPATTPPAAPTESASPEPTATPADAAHGSSAVP